MICTIINEYFSKMVKFSTRKIHVFSESGDSFCEGGSEVEYILLVFVEESSEVHCADKVVCGYICVSSDNLQTSVSVCGGVRASYKVPCSSSAIPFT